MLNGIPTNGKREHSAFEQDAAPEAEEYGARFEKALRIRYPLGRAGELFVI